MKVYKVLKEYPYYYLCESQFGYKECFTRALYRPNKNNEIVIIQKEMTGHEVDLSKVNRSFNLGPIINKGTTNL